MKQAECVRILTISTSYPLRPDDSSGIFVGRLVEALAKDHTVTVITPASSEIPLKYGRASLVAVRYAPRKFRVLAHVPGGIPAQLKKRPFLWVLVPSLLVTVLLATLRRARHADVLQANWAISGAIAAVVARLIPRPLIVTLRGDDVSGAKKGLASRMLLHFALRQATKIVTVSEAMRATLASEHPDLAHKVHHIPNGVDDLSAEAPSTPPKTRRLLSVGSLIERKGHSTLIRALQQLPSNYTLTIVGEGPERERINALIKTLNLQDRVRLTGSLPPQQMPNIYQEHDLFALASRSEGRPNVLMEALSAGLPVVASDIPGITEVVANSEAGIACPCDDAKAFSRSIQQIMEAPQRWLGLSAAGPIWINEQGLNWQASAAAYAHLMEDVIKASPLADNRK